MSIATAELLLAALGLYLAAGALFAAAFCTLGAGRLVAAAARAPWAFRGLLAPAATALWPWLAWRWITVVRNRQEPE